MRAPRSVWAGLAERLWKPRLAIALALAFATLLPSLGSGPVAAAGFAWWSPKPPSTPITPSTPMPSSALSATKLNPGGGEQDWSSLNQIIFEQPDSKGINQLYTENPDGSNLTRLPSPDDSKHKFNPSWYPNGQWFAAQVERPNYLIGMDSTPSWSEVLLNGLWCDLYVAKADGSQWYKLTNTSLNTDGVLFPIFSKDGSKLMWSRIVTRANSVYPWGQYRLMMGDFSIVNGTPTLSNVRDITPAGINFIEPGQFSPDGKSVVVSSDIDTTSSDKMNVLQINLATGTYVDLTKGSNLTWHEHPSYSPDGQHIIYMSGIPGKPVSADMVMINLDGSGWTQLTHFNDPGYPEYAGQLVYAYRARWSPDGKQLSVTVQSVVKYPARDVWVLNFP